MDRNDTTKVLIAGGGVAALEAALALRELAEDRVSIELLAPESSFWYRPLAVAAPFRLGEVRHFDLEGLTRSIGATFTPGALVTVDVWRQTIHTSTNAELPYDSLLVACGAVPTPAIPGARTFRGPADIEVVRHLLDELERGDIHSAAFAIPWGAAWSLPAYELALLTAAHLEARGVRGVELSVVTPEDEPLQPFGSPASAAVRELLAERGISIHTNAYAAEFAGDELRLIPEDSISVERVIALPRLRGAPIDGLPQTIHGFVPVDAHCRVHGLQHVYAAGDITSFTIKQGGIAAQQADAAAEAIAAAAGADVEPGHFRPVLRGLLLTGRGARYLRREINGSPEQEAVAAVEPLWWPPAKIVGRYLAPFLGTIAGAEVPQDLLADLPGTVSVDVELEPHPPSQPALAIDEPADGDVTQAMVRDPLVVAPEDTLGEVAERLVERRASAAVVAEYGHLIGILTTADLVRAYAARSHPSEARVRQWMTAEPVAVTSDTSLAAAAVLMEQYCIHHLPVLEGERPVGMLHFDDVSDRVTEPIGLGF